jgi:NDP-sugar pyrophosphorylase family protein
MSESAPLDAAMILAAGLGTRLRPLTEERPKPLVEVLGTPLIHVALEHARRAGAPRVAINTHHLHPAVEERLGPRFGDMELIYSHEPVILGTGGGVWQMGQKLKPLRGTFMLLNADALVDVDAAAMAAQHGAAQGAERAPLATLALKDTPDKARFGLIGTDDDDVVKTFAGRTAYDGPVARERMFCGVHFLEPRVLDWLPPAQESCINRVGYPRILDEGHAVHSFDVPGYFCDVGTPERLLEASLLLLSGRVKLQHVDLLSRFAEESGCYLAPGAKVEPGAKLIAPAVIDEGAVIEAGAVVGPHAVVGKDCRVGAGANLSRAILQSGTEISGGEVLEDVIASPSCRMAVDPSVADAALSGA